MDSITSDSALNDDDLMVGKDNEFGDVIWLMVVLFTNSLPIIYLQRWLNEKPETRPYAV
jgi:hypothetical protein